jgi:prepilin-type N-terminal cleavage/methylation domain-containing protein
MLNQPLTAVPRASRPAFSVIEVLVALVIITVGLLGVAGASAISLRAAAAAQRERAAIGMARTRLALLAAAGCVRAAGGARQTPDGFSEHWLVAHPRADVLLTEARVEWQGAGRRRTVVLEGARVC